MNSNRIFGLPDSPSADNDATSKKYVDASINMVTAAITTALGSSGTMVNNPTVASAGNASANYNVVFSNTPSGRASLLIDDGELYYNPNANTLYATKFSGALTGNATTASYASGNQFSIGSQGFDSYSSLYIKNPNQNLNNGTVQLSLDANNSSGTSKGVFDIGVDYTGYSYLYNRNNQSMQFGTSNTARMTITGAGLVGIGTGTPLAPLHVYGSKSIEMYTGTARYYNMFGQMGAVGGSRPDDISIISSNSLWIQGPHLWVTSDQRIKTNILNLNADKMMNIFRTIRPISFDYIDTMKNNNKKHFGFIAQEVKEVLPEGITLNTDVIPNNMMKGEIHKKSKIEASFTLKPDDTDISLNYLLLKTDTSVKFDTANTYSSTNVYKFKVSCGEKWSKEQDIYICSDYNVIDDKYTYVIGMKKDVYDIVITEPTLFIYGQYVYDLHILDHDTIYTVATAALQEVDRQQQADKIRIAELEATVAEQKSLINDILERLKTLEKA